MLKGGQLFRTSIALAVILASLKLAAAPGVCQEMSPMVEVKYLGHRRYPSFTRLTFDTGGFRPENFKVNFDEEGRRVVFYPTEGLLAFSFAPVYRVDSAVREVDFVQGDGHRRGIVVGLGTDAQFVRVSYLSDPDRLALDIYRKSGTAAFLPLGRKISTVVLDPGHGGRSYGAGAPGVLSEKDLALDVALRLRNLLARQGLAVVMTREADTDASNYDRAGTANNAKADLFLSLHAGASFARSGAATIYTMDMEEGAPAPAGGGPLAWDGQQAAFLPDSLRFARFLSDSMGGAYGAKPEIRQARLAGVDGLAMPAVLVELGSLSDPKQAKSLEEDAFRDRLAGLLAGGINRYINEVNQ